MVYHWWWRWGRQEAPGRTVVMGTGAKQFEITAIERLAASEGTVALALGGMRVGGSPGGIAATVILEEGFQLGVSQLVGETEWIVDSMMWPNGCPEFANGVGARYCKLKAVKSAELAAALDAAAEEVKR